ncbi:MAG: hypothetical protein QNJ33_03325 [Crocosphaera sp.]|nr:hypothetical protein [Crocosphaera sp.]
MANITISDLKKINSNDSNNSSNFSFLSDISVNDIKDIKGGFIETPIGFGVWW